MLKKSISSSLMAACIVALGFFSANAAAEDSLYTRLGGIYPIASTVDHLVDKIYENKGLQVNPALKAIHENKATKAGFKVMLTNWVVQETGGPKLYQQDTEFGRGKPLKEMHKHLNLSNREFDIIMTECRETFYAFNVPDHEIDQLMADLESYRKDIVTAKE